MGNFLKCAVIAFRKRYMGATIWFLGYQSKATVSILKKDTPMHRTFLWLCFIKDTATKAKKFRKLSLLQTRASQPASKRWIKHAKKN
jgi:hypothetical protein